MGKESRVPALCLLSALFLVGGCAAVRRPRGRRLTMYGSVVNAGDHATLRLVFSNVGRGTLYFAPGSMSIGYDCGPGPCFDGGGGPEGFDRMPSDDFIPIERTTTKEFRSGVATGPQLFLAKIRIPAMALSPHGRCDVLRVGVGVDVLVCGRNGQVEVRRRNVRGEYKLLGPHKYIWVRLPAIGRGARGK